MAEIIQRNNEETVAILLQLESIQLDNNDWDSQGMCLTVSLKLESHPPVWLKLLPNFHGDIYPISVALVSSLTTQTDVQKTMAGL